VYLHKDATGPKAEFYCRAVQLVPGGHFFSVKWETRVDRALKAAVSHPTDQWVQQPQGVSITAMWVCIRDQSQLRHGGPVAAVWDPQHEANPWHPTVFERAKQLYAIPSAMPKVPLVARDIFS
jgi:hypothetical protein